MSLHQVEGVLIEVEKSAVFDTWIEKAVLSVVLLKDNGEKVAARIVPSLGFEPAWMSSWVDDGQIILDVDAEAKCYLGIIGKCTAPVAAGERYCTSAYGEPSARIRVAIGDRVRIGWDYERFRGEIIEPAQDRSQKIDWAYPVKGERLFHAGDLAESLFPEAE